MKPKERSNLNQDPREICCVPKSFLSRYSALGSPIATDPEELRSFRATICSILNYMNDAREFLDGVERNLSSLSSSQRKLLKNDWPARRRRYLSSFGSNYEFLLKLVSEDLDIFPAGRLKGDFSFEVPGADAAKVRSALRQFRREWSAQGADERLAAFAPILEGLSRFFPAPKGVRVLVPGCGLGRLPFEIARLGFAVEGNEFSQLMFFCQKFVFSRFEEARIYPGLPFTVNLFDSEDPFLPCEVPDVDIFERPLEMSMRSGDFLKEYAADSGKWDSVVTCFFLDTGNNVLDYLECVHRLLRPGGVWLNCGPLLYHRSGISNEVSIDLSLEEILFAAQKLGFKVKEIQPSAGLYCAEKNSMMDHLYKNAYFSAVKEGFTC